MPLSPRRVVAVASTTAILSAAAFLGSAVVEVSGFSASGGGGRPPRSPPATAGVGSLITAAFDSSSSVHHGAAGTGTLRPSDCPFLRRMAGLERGGAAAGAGTGTALFSSVADQASPATTTAHNPGTNNLPNLPALTGKILSSFTSLDDLYSRSSSIRCPFFRRRAADAIDGAAMILRFLVIRHKSLGIFDPLIVPDGPDTDAVEGLLESTVRPPGWKAVGGHVRKNADGTVCKLRHLDLETIASTIRADWEVGPDKTKGYYITGRLNSTLYRDDCLFDGPDPDMPVRGLRKYLGAASHLFDSKSSRAELTSLEFEAGGGRSGRGLVVARWRLEGTLMLPWRPVVKPWTGTTRYHLDDDGLVYLHEESWDISVLEAFVCTVWPEVGERIWGRQQDNGLGEEDVGRRRVAP